MQSVDILIPVGDMVYGCGGHAAAPLTVCHNARAAAEEGATAAVEDVASLGCGVIIIRPLLCWAANAPFHDRFDTIYGQQWSLQSIYMHCLFPLLILRVYGCSCCSCCCCCCQRTDTSPYYPGPVVYVAVCVDVCLCVPGFNWWTIQSGGNRGHRGQRKE